MSAISFVKSVTVHIGFLFHCIPFAEQNNRYKIQHTRFSKDPIDLTGGQKMHESMIFLLIIFNGATGVIRE